MKTTIEKLGDFVGAVLAPFIGLGSFVRGARLFHPEGIVFQGTVKPLASQPRLAEVGARLEGPALIRLSSGWWRGGREWPDVLGIAIRFRSSETVTEVPAPGDQDLLVATFRRLWTLPFAPLSTEQHDFLANDYFGAAPFDVEGLGRVYLRLSHPRPVPDRPTGTHTRVERLLEAAAQHQAVFHLDARRIGRRLWWPIAEVALTEQVQIDQEALRYSPFRVGRGIRPRGFVHAIRRRTYRISQAARALHAQHETPATPPTPSRGDGVHTPKPRRPERHA